MVNLICGRLLWFVDDPRLVGESAYRYIEKGALVIAAGQILAVGEASDVRHHYPDAPCKDYGRCLILPGFIDTHTHMPQAGVIASYGEQLLDWLNDYIFPAEERFADPAVCEREADFFLQQLFANGTTTAMVYGTSHAQSVDAFFNAAHAVNARMVAGKVLMDRSAPAALLDTPQSGYDDSKRLIDRWHGRDRLLYAVTPRFAPTSSPEQLAMAGDLMRSADNLFMQTHLSENPNEIAWVTALFPAAKHYLDVYDRVGLLGERSIFGHGIHVVEDEIQRLADTGSSIAFCPSSNLFLGSGLLDVDQLLRAGVGVSVATDVGAGTHFSMLYTLNQAYKVLQLQGQKLHPFEAFYRITLGNARCMGLDQRIGKLQSGYEADFVVLDPAATDLSHYRTQRCESLAEELFCAQIMGDDRWITATYVAGKCVYTRDQLGLDKNSITEKKNSKELPV